MELSFFWWFFLFYFLSIAFHLCRSHNTIHYFCFEKKLKKKKKKKQHKNYSVIVLHHIRYKCSNFWWFFLFKQFLQFILSTTTKKTKPILMRRIWFLHYLQTDFFFFRWTMSTKESRLASSIVVLEKKKNGWIELKMQEINIISSDLLITLLTFFFIQTIWYKAANLFRNLIDIGHWNKKKCRNSLILMHFWCNCVWTPESICILFIVATLFHFFIEWISALDLDLNIWSQDEIF